MTRHPVEWIDGFLKEAAIIAKPYGISEAGKAMRRPPQTYSRPQTAVSATPVGVTAAQKSVQPPPT